MTADVAVRHHAVEELLDADAPPRPRDQQTSTVVAELGNIAGIGQQRWTVRDESDVESVARSIVVYNRQHGEPFLARFSDASEVLRVLAADGPEARLLPDPGPAEAGGGGAAEADRVSRSCASTRPRTCASGSQASS